MRKIEFSTMTDLQSLMLDEFEAKNFITVSANRLDWAVAWNQILQIGLYHKGPDLSEVGSTWLENLSGMRALRPFTPGELRSLGGREAFVESSWEEFGPPQASEVVSVPWTLDTRLVTYRADLLEKAGIKEVGAFATPEAFHDTLACLQAAGHRYPLLMATGGHSLHNMASWVWGRGGNFRSEDYRKVTLVEPEARAGMLDFFSLYKYIDPANDGLTYSDADAKYYQSEAPVLFSGQWVLNSLDPQNGLANPEVCKNSVMTPPPGLPYVGSAHLSIWRHSMNDAESIEFIRHLLSPEIYEKMNRMSGVFPARLSVINSPTFQHPRFDVVIDCLKRGRNFRTGKLWAGVEMRLSDLLHTLWTNVFSNPDINLEAEIDQRVGDLAKRLERTLLAN